MKFIKSNIISILSILFLIGYTVFGMFLYYKSYDIHINSKMYERCISDSKFYELRVESCDELKNYNNLTDDTYTIFYQVFRVYDYTVPLVYIMPLFVIIPAIWQIQKEISSNYAKNYLTRNNYKSYIKRMIRNVYKHSWILPLYCIIVFIVSYMFSGHFDYSFSVNHSIATYDIYKLKLGGFFIAGLILNVFFHSLAYCNLALICVRKNKNVILTILETFLLWYGIVLVVEIIGGILIQFGIIDRNISLVFALLNIYSLDETPNIIYVLIFGLICFIASFIAVKLVYRNKEKNVICWER